MTETVPDLVSTIIPVYNRGKLVVEAMESVLNQTHQPVECILVDDGSTDDTPAILDRLAEENPDRVRVIHKSNSGPGPSREAGRQIARGEFIQYLDSDDLLAPTKFAEQVAALRAQPEAALCYGITEYYRLNEEANRKVFAGTDRPVDRIFPASLVRRQWGTSSPLYRRTVTDRIGPWGGMWAEEDWEYDCRIGALGMPVAHVNRLVSSQRGLVGQRLSQQGRDDPRTLASQAEARGRILGYALDAGISTETAEMDHFLRGLFMLARDCGGAGLAAEAEHLCDMLISNTPASGLRRTVRGYRAAARLLGWRALSHLVRLGERVRSTLR